MFDHFISELVFPRSVAHTRAHVHTQSLIYHSVVVGGIPPPCTVPLSSCVENSQNFMTVLLSGRQGLEVSLVAVLLMNIISWLLLIIFLGFE